MVFVEPSVLDTFNRANSTTTLGLNWSLLDNFNVSGGLGQQGIISNQAYNPAAPFVNYSAMYWNAQTFGPDSAVCWTLGTVPSSNVFACALYIRVRQPGHSTHDGYIFVYDKTDNVGYIARIDNGAYTVLGTTFALTLANGDKMGLDANKNVISAYKYTAGAWATLASRTDGTYPDGGFLGMYISGDVVDGRFDDFCGGNISILDGIEVYDPQRFNVLFDEPRIPMFVDARKPAVTYGDRRFRVLFDEPRIPMFYGRKK